MPVVVLEFLPAKIELLFEKTKKSTKNLIIQRNLVSSQAVLVSHIEYQEMR